MNRPKEPQELLTKESSQKLTPKEFIEREEAMSTIAMRERAVGFLFIVYGGVLGVTMSIIVLQGFHLWGFSLERVMNLD